MQGKNVILGLLGELTKMNVGFVVLSNLILGTTTTASYLVLSKIPAFMWRLVLLAETCVQPVSAGIFDFYPTHKDGVCYAR